MEKEKTIQCPICNAVKLFTHVESTGDNDRVGCNSCGLIFYVAVPEKMPRYDVDYNSFFYRPTDIQKAGIMACNIAKLHSLTQKKKRILEIGPGNGMASKLLAMAKFEIKMIERERETAEWLTAKTGIKCEHWPFELSNYKNEFDVIYAGHTIEHSPAPKVFMEKAFDALDEGGIFFLDTPDTQYQKKYGEMWKHLRTRQNFEHLFLFSQLSMRILAESVGFKVCNLSSDIEYQSLQAVLSKPYNLKKE